MSAILTDEAGQKVAMLGDMRVVVKQMPASARFVIHFYPPAVCLKVGKDYFPLEDVKDFEVTHTEVGAYDLADTPMTEAPSENVIESAKIISKVAEASYSICKAVASKCISKPIAEVLDYTAKELINYLADKDVDRLVADCIANDRSSLIETTAAMLPNALRASDNSLWSVGCQSTYDGQTVSRAISELNMTRVVTEAVEFENPFDELDAMMAEVMQAEEQAVEEDDLGLDAEDTEATTKSSFRSGFSNLPALEVMKSALAKSWESDVIRNLDMGNATACSKLEDRLNYKERNNVNFVGTCKSTWFMLSVLRCNNGDPSQELTMSSAVDKLNARNHAFLRGITSAGEKVFKELR